MFGFLYWEQGKNYCTPLAQYLALLVVSKCITTL